MEDIKNLLQNGDLDVTPKEDFEDPGDKNCEKCGSSYSPVGTFIHYIKEEEGYIGQDPGYCPVCVNSNGYEHTGKKECEDCGNLYDPRNYMHELKEGIWEGEDLGKCLSCAKPWEVEQETYALSCSCCGKTIPHGEGITTTYHHDSKRKKESIIVCSTECENQMTRTGF